MIRLLLLLALSASAAHAQTWEWLNPTPNGNTLRSVVELPDGTLYAGGSYGVVLRSTDGGQTFVDRSVPTRALTAAVGFADAETGWMAAREGEVFGTTDGGASWTLQLEAPLGSGFASEQVEAASADVAWVRFRDGSLYRTENGGTAWTRVVIDGDDAVSYVRAFDASSAVVVDGNELHRTTDGGQTWTTGSVESFGQSILGRYFVSPEVGWLVGQHAAVVATTDGGQTWTQQLGSPDSSSFGRHAITEVHFADAQNGWATASECLYRTSDGGVTWDQVCGSAGSTRKNGVLRTGPGSGYIAVDNQLLYSDDDGATFTDLVPGFKASLLASAMVDLETGWAVGSNGAALRTGDGWSTFDVRPTGTDAALYGVAAASAEAAWAVGDGGAILATADGGATWTSRESGVTVDLNSVHFADGQTGWIAGDDGTMLTTADGGATWTAQDSGTLSDIAGVYFPTPTTGFAYVFFPGSVLGTTDGDATWTLLPTPPEGRILTSLFFLDDQTGWVGGIGLILHTTDGGASWTTVPDYPFDSSAADIYFTSAEEGWVFGSNGTVLGYSSTVTTAEPTPGGLARLAVYPNPSAGPATLALALDASAEVTLTVHDALGRGVARQRLALGAGEHRLALPVGLAPGLYVAVAEAGGERLGTARFTVVR